MRLALLLLLLASPLWAQDSLVLQPGQRWVVRAAPVKVDTVRLTDSLYCSAASCPPGTWSKVKPGPTPTPPPDTVLPPPVSGCPPTGYKRLRPVSSTSALQSAINSAVAGDQIQIADGTYSGTLYVTAKRGTAADSMTLCGTAKAVVAGAVHITDAHYWRFLGFVVRDGWIGFEVRRSTNNRFSLEIANVDYSGIKLFDGSNANLVTGAWIHHTGRKYPEYGEGVYLGEGRSSQPSNFYVANDNRIIGNRLGPHITAEAVDIKTATKGTQVLDNEIDATGFTLIWTGGKTTGVIDANGEGTVVQGNTVRNANWTPPAGTTIPNWGVFRSFRSSGAGVLYTKNTIIGPTTARRAFDTGNAGSTTVVRCDNVKPANLPWGTTCSQVP